MSNRGTLPHFEIAEHIDGYADRGGYGVEEDEVGEGSESKGPGGRVQNVHRYKSVASTPGNPCRLFLRSACPSLCQGRNWQRCRKCKGCPRRWLGEDLVLCADTAVFVSMASPLADILVFCVSIAKLNSVT